MSCNDKNSLVREGCSIYNRVLAAIRTNYARVDEREIADIILFAKRYAAYLNYYDQNNILAGDWQTLMKMDACVSLAALSGLNTKSVLEYRQLLYKRIKEASQEATDADAKTMKVFKFLFDLIFSLAGFIDEQYILIPSDLHKKDMLKGSINNKMADALENLHILYQEFSTTLNLLTASDNTTDQVNVPMVVQPSGDFHKEELSDAWAIGEPAYDIITLVTVPPRSASFTEKDQVIWIINHNLFNAQVDNLLKGVAFISATSKDIFNQVVTDYPKHSPHYTLFLSFLKLFRIAQDDLNRYTQRHLDFYYKDVLQLGNKAAQPDQAHLLFELPKPVDQHFLKKDTEFNGGKDSAGKELRYKLTEDVVLSKASIEKIHSWQRLVSGKLKAAVIGNSDNGKDPGLAAADKSWFTFGDPDKAPFAEAGFGIASNILFLTEGSREITCTIRFKNDLPGLNSGNLESKPVFIKANITGKKGWHKISGPVAKFTSANTLECICSLDADAPAVISYSEALHKSNLHISLPLLQVFIDQEKENGIPYTALCHQAVESINMIVEVTGIKDLALSHDNGTIDPSKPFKPFGDFPVSGASFYIGSNEAFQKKLTSVTLGFDWVNDTPAMKDKASFLSKNNWSSKFGFSGKTLTVDDSFKQTAPNYEKNSQLQPGSTEGYLRIKLDQGRFSYKQYLEDISAALKDTTLKTDPEDSSVQTLSVGTMPAPNELVTNGFTLDYSASETFVFGSGNNPEHFRFIHFTAFGYRVVPPKFNNDNAFLEEIEHYSLIPDVVHDAELFLGIANTEPGSVINVLFQVAEGSSNPLKDMETVGWYYMNKHQHWEKFKTSDIIDRSNNFTESGIVTITLPANISSTNTSFTNGLYWIKAVVENNTDAVCRMILIQAQAARVILKQDELNQVEFRQTLKANSISKLTNGDPSIKKITQPSDSFGGRTRELDDQFYVRVSERLRHKQRAISIWDYEHLVLEEFQSIFKVRCLNHSGFYMDGNEEVFCENYPGHVTLITIPNLRSGTYTNPLRPYTSSRVLNNIHQFISRLKSPFVKLHVKNPRFEEVQLDFKVKFHEHIDEAFYLKLLNDEIERFLCPWAYDESKEISFGGKVIRSVILNFVEERPYVDYVTCFKMNHIITRNGNLHISEKQDVEEAIASTSRSLLVSYFNEESNTKHKIVSSAECEC